MDFIWTAKIQFLYEWQGMCWIKA